MVEKSYENDKVASVEEARSALLTLAMIAEKYPEHHSSKMNKVMNQLTTRCLQTSYNDVHEFIKIVAAVASYNPNKACALFLKNCKIVEGNVSKLER